MWGSRECNYCVPSPRKLINVEAWKKYEDINSFNKNEKASEHPKDSKKPAEQNHLNLPDIKPLRCTIVKQGKISVKLVKNCMQPRNSFHNSRYKWILLLPWNSLLTQHRYRNPDSWSYIAIGHPPASLLCNFIIIKST